MATEIICGECYFHLHILISPMQHSSVLIRTIERMMNTAFLVDGTVCIISVNTEVWHLFDGLVELSVCCHLMFRIAIHAINKKVIWPGFHVSDVYARAGAKGIQSNSGGGQGGSALRHCTNNAG